MDRSSFQKAALEEFEKPLNGTAEFKNAAEKETHQRLRAIVNRAGFLSKKIMELQPTDASLSRDVTLFAKKILSDVQKGQIIDVDERMTQLRGLEAKAGIRWGPVSLKEKTPEQKGHVNGKLLQ